MKILFPLLFLVSCASSEPACRKVADEQLLGIRVVEFQCPLYTKYCKFDVENNQNLGCFVQQGFKPREWIQ